MTKPIRIACVVAAALFFHGRAHAQGTGNDRCVQRINNDARKVLDARAKANRRCLRLYAGTSAEACIAAPDAKTDAKKAKLASTFTSRCSASPPSFGLASGGAVAIAAAAQRAANDIVHDLLGGSAGVGTGDEGRCQDKVVQRAGQLAVAHWRTFRACKSRGLSGFADATELAAACLGGPHGPQPDPQGTVSTRVAKLGLAVQSKCVAKGLSPLGAVFTGSCSAAADADFTDCVRHRIACRFCEAVQAADGLPAAALDCDLFDNGAADASCVPPPPPTLTPTVTATVTVTPTTTPTPTTPPTPTIPAICQSQVNVPPLAQVPFTILPGSTFCGGPGLNPPAVAPFSGSVEDGSAASLGDLGVGCLHAGAFDGIRLPSGGTAVLNVVGLHLLPPQITLGGSDGSGPFDCTRGAGPDRHCSNGATGTDGMGSCSSDVDCGGAPGACNLDANCFFGPPIPIVALQTVGICVVNAFLTDLCGQVSLLPPAANLATALSARVYLTGALVPFPCPQCLDGVCTYGKNAGEPCTPLGSDNTSSECLPDDSSFLSTMTVPITSLNTGTSVSTNPSGFFCPGQTTVGALGLAGARTITETGTPPGGGGSVLSMTLGSTFCVPASGHPLLDGVAKLPGPGAVSAAGEIDLSQVLPLFPLSP
jgi:hypothetical protein